MVCGFFAAVILMNMMGRLLGAGFEIFVGGTMQTKLIGITGTFAMLVILGIVVIMTANKFFSLIHYLPEHVTNWIGQQFHALGEKEDQTSVKKRLCRFHQCGFFRRSWGTGTARRHFAAMEQSRPRRGHPPDGLAASSRPARREGNHATAFQELTWTTRKKPSSVALI